MLKKTKHNCWPVLTKRCFPAQHFHFDSSKWYVGFSVTYLHGESLSINGVLWSWSPIPSPVEVKLGGSVMTRQSSSSQSDRLRQSKVSYREERLSLNTGVCWQTRGVQHPAKHWSGGKEKLCGLFITRVSFVFCCNVDRVGVTDEVKGWQGAVDVHFAGDNVNWWLA